MKLKTLAVQIAALTLVSTPLFADDGVLLSKEVSQNDLVYPCVSDGEHGFIRPMNFHVPAQHASGELTEIVYETVDGATDTQVVAKPLVAVYVYGPVLGVEGADGFQGHGLRDVYAAISLDDGESWKSTNISLSAGLSSFEMPTTSLPDITQGECEEIPIDWNTAAGVGDVNTDNLLASLDVVAASSAETVLTECDGEFCLTEALAIDVPSPATRLEILGFSPYSQASIEIINGVTGDHVTNIRTKDDGTIVTTQRRFVSDDEVPCTIQAVFGDEMSNTIAVANAPPECIGPPVDIHTITDYPGDNNNVFHAVAGNKILVAWQSRFCQSGAPASTRDVDTIAAYLGIDNSVDVYLTDLFGVEGSQNFINYADEGFPQVGEIPYNCLWTARGILREDPENAGATEVVWFQSERLTSGRRDLTRIETMCAVGGGCAITWQEDPVGLRPGEGEGPGTGWSGATANSKTDLWYTFLPWAEFDTVDCNGTPTPLQDCADPGSKPSGFVPFAVPMRLTNNDRCTVPPDGSTEVTYCNGAVATNYGFQDFCADTVDIPLGPQGNLESICVNEDGLPNVANTAATRPRLNVRPRDTDGDGVTDDAWVIVVSEEDKGLGRFGFLDDQEWNGSLEDLATSCLDPDADLEDNCDKADLGKNTFYASFAMGTAKTSDSEDGFGVIDNMNMPGAQINKPEVNWKTGDLYPPMDTADMWDFTGNNSGADYNFHILASQIARRTALMTQTVAKAAASSNGLVAMPLFKEGIMNQGGPADIQAVQVKLPCVPGGDDDDDDDDFPGMGEGPPGDDDDDDCVIDQMTANPYAPENLVCGNRWFDDGSNPYYPNGICMLSTINLSGLTPDLCEASGDLSFSDCPGSGAIPMECVDDPEFGQLCSATMDPENQQLFPKLLTWYECPGSNDTSVLAPACGETDVSQLLGSNIDDQAWYMPLDVSKAHRGFLDGDYVLMMYAKSPNWKLNVFGADRYELYLRKSFDGGSTWTTTPENFVASNGETYNGIGNTTCETWRTASGVSSDLEEHNCTTYEAGAPEQSRNMSQLKSMAFTILDPRFAPNMGGMVPLDLSLYGSHFTYEPVSIHGAAPTDVRRPDRMHIAFETGDNTTVAIGEGEPLNMLYGRGVMFADNFQVWSEEDDLSTCWPSNPQGDPSVDELVEGSGFCNEFDALEGSRTALSEEASMFASAAGDFMYAVFGQINLTTELEHIDGEMHFRRVWWLDDYIPSDAWENLIGQGE